MKKLLIVIIIVIIAGGALYYYLQSQKGDSQSESQNPQTNGNITKERELMKITSPAFGHNQNIPSKYTCDGENVNPPLEFSDVPANASSLALIMDDPDAPMGTWVHWLFWSIPPAVSSIPENSVPPSAAQGLISSGQNRYGGPCPPSGTHRYFFKLFALDVMLDLPSSSTKKDLENAMEGHVIAKAELVGTYARK